MESTRTQDLLAKVTEDPNDWEHRTQAAEALLDDGHPGEAIALLDAAPSPPEFDRHVLKAVEVYNKVDPTKSVQLLHDYLQENPQAALVHMAMAETAAMLGDFHGAGLYYNCAIQINPAYRDADFEEKFNVSKEKKASELDLAKTMTVPVSARPQPYKGVNIGASNAQANEETVPVDVRSEEPSYQDLPTADPSAETSEPISSSPAPAEVAAAEATKKKPTSRKKNQSASAGKRRQSRSSTNWLVTTLVAGAVFISCWVIVLLVLQLMFAQ